MAGAGYVIEESPQGRSVVVSGPWSLAADEVFRRGDADGLVLNYARGFRGAGLEFLNGDWGLRRLDVLDRELTDLRPIGRLGSSLQDLSVQAAPNAKLDLGALPHLRSVAGEWALLRGTLGAVDALQNVNTWLFDEADLHAFRDHVGLQRLSLKEAPLLHSLSGVTNLAELVALNVVFAGRLFDISDITDLAESLRRLDLQACPAIGGVGEVESLVNLRFLGISDCEDIESLGPLAPLRQLEVLSAWGSTRVVDGDLSPLLLLPRLSQIRMRDRGEYRPRVSELQAGLPASLSTRSAAP